MIMTMTSINRARMGRKPAILDFRLLVGPCFGGASLCWLSWNLYFLGAAGTSAIGTGSANLLNTKRLIDQAPLQVKGCKA